MDIFYPIELLAGTISYEWFGLVRGSYAGSAVNFFIYDTIKIGLLLIVINYVMAIARYYFPVEKIRDILSSRKWYGLDYVLAAGLGVITPFCSCSSIPLFIGFVSAGIPLGVTFSFLIASPLVNEASLFIFPSVFGLKMTIVYNLLGITISVIAGMIIQRLKMDKHVNPAFLKFKTQKEAVAENEGNKVPLVKRLKMWWQDGIRISKSILPYVILGVGLGAIIHGYVPESFVETYLNNDSWWVVPLATIMGIPLYANSVSVIPVVEALANKGVAIGTALAFMTATVTLSIPGLLILKKAMNWKLLSAFIIITSVGIMIIGYFFNIFTF
ncbi:MAG: permease [Patescibacteria group bacterium]